MSMDHSFSTYTKFFEKLTFLTPTGKRACAYQGVRDVVFWKILILHTQEHIKKIFPCTYTYLSKEFRGCS